ncbi:MAG: hypothetical protein ACI4CE_07395 [Methanomethylophilus alvi]
MNNYKFTEAEKDYIFNHVYCGNRKNFKADLPQIESAVDVAAYYYYEGEREVYIGRDEARRMLGTEEWLSGVSRAAFHWTASREAVGGQTIFIDCSQLFK